MSFHRLVLSAALASGLACAAPFACAREPVRVAAAAVAVENVDVEQVAELRAGVSLNFTVFGTPASLVSLRIDGARRVLELREAEPGIYEGSYVMDGRDAIGPASRVTATLQRNGAVAYSSLDEPLLLAPGAVPWDSGVATPTPMPVPIPVVPARAQSQPVPPAAFAAAPPLREHERCADCAVVESVRAVEAAPRGGAVGGVVGSIGGAIAGAILGKEAGEAHTRRVLTVLGAIGGAFAGREIERQATRATHYEVDLRLADGTVLKRRYEQAPPFAAGETIRLGAQAGRRTPAPSL